MSIPAVTLIHHPSLEIQVECIAPPVDICSVEDRAVSLEIAGRNAVTSSTLVDLTIRETLELIRLLTEAVQDAA